MRIYQTVFSTQKTVKWDEYNVLWINIFEYKSTELISTKKTEQKKSILQNRILLLQVVSLFELDLNVLVPNSKTKTKFVIFLLVIELPENGCQSKLWKHITSFTKSTKIGERKELFTPKCNALENMIIIEKLELPPYKHIVA